jgi:hypothetical protein
MGTYRGDITMKIGLALLAAALAIAIAYKAWGGPYTARREKISEHITRNMTSGYYEGWSFGLGALCHNGLSYTGYNHLQVETAVYTSKMVSVPDTRERPYYKVGIQQTGSRRISVGLTPIREASDWQEFDDYQRQLCVVGVGVQFEF